MPNRTSPSVQARRTQIYAAVPNEPCQVDVAVKDVGDTRNAYILLTVVPKGPTRPNRLSTSKHWILSLSLEEAAGLASLLCKAVSTRSP